MAHETIDLLTGARWKIQGQRIIYQGSGATVALLNVDWPNEDIERHARLIASAPDLLEACRAIAALDEGQGRLNMPQVAGQARQAIAEAEGVKE